MEQKAAATWESPEVAGTERAHGTQMLAETAATWVPETAAAHGPQASGEIGALGALGAA
jgi:hypothetical protein